LALYQWQIIGLVSFCAIVTLLIVGLLIQRSRHGRAKDSLRNRSFYSIFKVTPREIVGNLINTA
jgi:hypothetical protein